MAEGAALDVLAGQPDRNAVGQDGREAPVPRPRPSRPFARSGCRTAPFRRSRPRSSFLWNVKPSGADQQRRVDLRAGGRPERRSRSWPPCPAGAGSETGATKSSSGLSDANACSSTVKCFFTSASAGSRGDRSLRDELLGKQLAHGLVRGDRLVHQRLRERRLVAFVVAESPVADQIDQEVAARSARGIPTPAAPPRGTPPDRRR